MFRWWHTVHHHLGKITFPDTRSGQELDTEPDTALAAWRWSRQQARGQVLSVKIRGQGSERECSSMGDEAHRVPGINNRDTRGAPGSTD